MARFYGTVQGQRGEATRLGHSGLTSTTRSYAGSVIVMMYLERDVEYVRIGVGERSTSCIDYTLYDGPVKGLFDDRINLKG